VEADAIRGQLQRALAGRPLNEADCVTQKTVEGLLDGAQSSTRGVRRRRGIVDRWRGTSVERAHNYLHAAKAAIVDVLDEDDVDALIPDAVARVATSLESTDMRRPSIDALMTDELNLNEKRARLRQALEIGYDGSDRTHARLRSFRNLLVGVGVTILLFMATMVTVVSIDPKSLPLCFTPSITSAQVDEGNQVDRPATRTVCPSGEDPINGPFTRQPGRKDISIVAGLGVVGGAVAAALAIRHLRGTSTPYDVPLALAFLKVPVGSLTAVAAIILLGGGFVPGFSELDSQRQILAYALLFGYAQQVATQFIDKNAQRVLNAVPSKDSEGKNPSQAPPRSHMKAETVGTVAPSPTGQKESRRLRRGRRDQNLRND